MITKESQRDLGELPGAERARADKHLLDENWSTIMKISHSLAMILAGVCAASDADAARLASPSYFYPDCLYNVECLWHQLDVSAPNVGLAIINPDSGPGVSQLLDYVLQRLTSRAVGISLVGYVPTQYGARSAAEVKADIDKYFSWYDVDGIFLDEVPSDDCGAQAYYADLNSYIKSRGRAAALTVLNPGMATRECFMSTGDIVVTFEGSYTEYVTWSTAGWESRYPASRFWHIVHSAPTEADMLDAMSLSKRRHAGWIYITPDTLPEPYDTLPTGAYWMRELGAAP